MAVDVDSEQCNRSHRRLYHFCIQADAFLHRRAAAFSSEWQEQRSSRCTSEHRPDADLDGLDHTAAKVCTVERVALTGCEAGCSSGIELASLLFRPCSVLLALHPLVRSIVHPAVSGSAADDRVRLTRGMQPWFQGNVFHAPLGRELKYVLSWVVLFGQAPAVRCPLALYWISPSLSAQVLSSADKDGPWPSSSAQRNA